MLALVTERRYRGQPPLTYISGLYLPQLSGLIKPGLWQLSLTPPKRRHDAPDATLHLASLPRKEHAYAFYINPTHSPVPDVVFRPRIYLCERSLLAMFGIIPSAIYLKHLKP